MTVDRIDFSAASPVTNGMRVVVVGAGKSGEAALRLVVHLGGVPRLLERNPERVTPEMAALVRDAGGDIITGPHKPAHFEGMDLVVPSPGVPLAALLPLAREAGNVPVMSEMELASRLVAEPIIAVTGTSGKTTTVSLIASMLEESGKNVFLGGNIGTPLSEYVLSGEKADVLVLEASSFQLQGCSSFHPTVAVLLNLSPNHLDQHTDMNEYREAKFAIFRNQGPEDIAILGPGLDEEAARHRLAAHIRHFSVSDRFPEALLLGKHNRANMEAAYLAAHQFGVSEKAAARAVAAFAPLPHRLEPVGTWNGVLYVNDSKATTPDALAVALESMDRPVLLLAGGIFKGGDLAALVPLIREKVREIALFGANRETFEAAWHGAAPISWSPTLEEAARHLRGHARAGDAILLAPASSSFDLYENYGKRGEDFRRIAELLQ